VGQRSRDLRSTPDREVCFVDKTATRWVLVTAGSMCLVAVAVVIALLLLALLLR
jgi:hypothetical protein